ncbi:MAG: hypothetical protein J7L11_10315 [Thermoprotei archaeon]|nr:hypothetical protein [Thermoprotei archaeon]
MKHSWNVILLILSWTLFFACLWQLEIAFIRAWERKQHVDLPFKGRVNIWFYRDLLYLGLFMSMVMEFIALWLW